MIHGDSIISGVTTEQPDKRPSCAWPIEREVATPVGKQKAQVPCGSEERVYNVKGQGRFRQRETPVCEKHLPYAWGKWNVDSATPL